MQPLLTQIVQRLSWIVLALGMAAGVLWLLTAADPGYQPIAQALLGLGCLSIGWLLGRVVRPIGRGGPRIPLTADAVPAGGDAAGRVWLRGFAAGFWTLVGLGTAVPLLYDLGVRLPGMGPVLLPVTQFLFLLFGMLLCVALPLATARGMLLDEDRLPRAAPVYAAVAACAGAWSVVIAVWLLMFALQSLSLGSGLAELLWALSLVVAAAGTPFLARSHWPALRGGMIVPLVLPALLAGWLLRTLLDGWISPTLPGASVLWLLPLCLLWGSSLTAWLVVLSARRRAAPAPDGDSPPRRVGLLALGAVAFSLLLMLLVPMGAWLLLSLGSGTAAPPPAAPLPNALQPGTLSVPGPTLLEPAPGVTPSGSVCTFRWSPPPSAGPGTLYQFTLWAPGVAVPITQFLTPTPQAQVQLSASEGRRFATPWTWRVRAILPGQGAGQWSESRPFTPAWK